MKLIVGLGNPGKRYTNTRHNVGFLCLDRLIEEFPFTPRISKRIRAIYYTRDRELILAKPHAFVNNSGKVVKDLMERFKVSIKDLLIIHDDLDLPLGEYKMSRSQGSAGHKGVQSIIEKLSSKDFRRIRIGIGRPPFFIPAEKYVLQNFSSEEKKILDSVFVALKEQLKKYLLKK